MNISVLLHNKHKVLLSHLCLSVALSAFSAPSLFASKDLTVDTEMKGMKRMSDLGRHRDEELSNKRQKVENTMPSMLLWDSIMIKDVFFQANFKTVRAGACVSKTWNKTLNPEVFYPIWGTHFSPSTPISMGMTPKDFILHWITPSFKIMSDARFKDIKINVMSSNGANIWGEALDAENNNRLVSVFWDEDKAQNGGDSLIVHATSADGSALVGWASDTNDNFSTPGVYKDNKFTTLDLLSSAEREGAGIIVSGNGSTIVGQTVDASKDYTRYPVRYIEDECTVLPLLKDSKEAKAHAISEDGSIIVGQAKDGANNDRITPLLWTKNMVAALPLPKGAIEAQAHATSADGSIIVGQATDVSNGTKRSPVRWTNNGVTALPLLKDSSEAKAHAMNANGSTIVGETYVGIGGKKPTLWRDGDVFSIKSLLKKSHPLLKAALEGLHLVHVDKISANGLQIVGTFISKGTDRTERPFIAILPSKHS
jgi:uncharacterized membrane protein